MKKILATLVVLLSLSTAVLAYQNWQTSHGDLNHDGRTNTTDLSILLSHYKK